VSAQSYTFSHAITRTPAATIGDGLRAVDTGEPDLELFRDQHGQYVRALGEAGVDIVVLDPLDEFPDSVFVEDTALCLPEGAVILRPGVSSRLGEAAAMASTLATWYGELLTVQGPGFIEGGDILTTEREIIVGRSKRTDDAGIDELRRLVSRWGRVVREVTTPSEILHYKTDCSLLDEETVLVTDRLAAGGFFDDYRVVRTAPGEESAANSVRVNHLVIMPSGFPRTAERISSLGYEVRQVGNSEAAKLDGGMSCLSLRFAARNRGRSAVADQAAPG
jgi:dimethylargininase